MKLQELLTQFDGVKRLKDNSYQCKCPAHLDKRASLTISEKDGKVLLHCHAGCNTENILEHVGLTFKDLHTEPAAASMDWQAYVEHREKRKIEAIYPYTFLNGSYSFTKLRLQGKKILYGILEKDRFTYGLNGKSRKELKAIYGDLQAIKAAIKEDRLIFIPEGEKDVDTLVKNGYSAFTYGGVNDWQSEFSALVEKGEVVILADNDEAGKKVAKIILNDIRNLTKSARIIVPTPDIEKGDILDYFKEHSKEEFEEMLKQEQTKTRITEDGFHREDVLEMLSYKITYDRDGNEKSRKILQTVRNVEIILEKDSRFAGKIKFDEFSQQTYLMRDMLWESKNNYRAWSSYDDSALFSILQSDYEMSNRNDYFDAIKNISMRNKFHPVKELLDSLKWDGREHIKKLLPDYLGVEECDYQYQVMRLWMLGAVSRIYKPGCKFDYTIILQGKQGLGKSTFLQLMALHDGWFNDSLDSLDSDKAAQSLMGSWIIELAELKSLARTAGGVDSVKRFLSAQQDKIRLPYERRTDIFLRQCVFAGTTNRSDFLQDETGNRRFLIIQTGINEPKKSLFTPEVMTEIKAAWAQAVHIMKTENPNLILPDSCKKHAELLQEECLSDDGKTGIITEYLANKQRTCALEIWKEALKETGRPKKWQASEINTIISKLPDWKRMTSPAKFEEYGSKRGFHKCSKNSLECSSILKECSSDFIKIDDSQLPDVPFH